MYKQKKYFSYTLYITVVEYIMNLILLITYIIIEIRCQSFIPLDETPLPP